MYAEPPSFASKRRSSSCGLSDQKHDPKLQVPDAQSQSELQASPDARLPVEAQHCCFENEQEPDAQKQPPGTTQLWPAAWSFDGHVVTHRPFTQPRYDVDDPSLHPQSSNAYARAAARAPEPRVSAVLRSILSWTPISVEIPLASGSSGAPRTKRHRGASRVAPGQLVFGPKPAACPSEPAGARTTTAVNERRRFLRVLDTKAHEPAGGAVEVPWAAPTDAVLARYACT